MAETRDAEPFDAEPFDAEPFDAKPFDAKLQAWTDYTETPWARIRYAVVRRTLADSLNLLGPGPHRILDVGGGDGQDALPLARAGHHVTILDPAETWLATARERAAAVGAPIHTVVGGLDDLPGAGGDRFDLVVCHFVLQYREDEAADVAALVGTVRPGGLLSVIAPNPVGATLSRLVREGPAEGLAELHRTASRTVTFDTEVRKIPAEAVEAALATGGCALVGRYGGRIANDLLPDDAAKSDADYYSELERLELALCDREPYCRIGAFWQLVARKPARPGVTTRRR